MFASVLLAPTRLKSGVKAAMLWCISPSHLRDTVAATLISKKNRFLTKKWPDVVVLIPKLQFTIRRKTHPSFATRASEISFAAAEC